MAAMLLPMSVWAVDGVLTKDAYITTANTAGNYGNLPSMNVGVGATSLVEFSLGSLPNTLVPSQIEKAVLVFYVNRVAATGNISIATVTPGWGELTVTQATAPSTGAPIASGISVSQTGYIYVDVTSAVQNGLAGGAVSFGIAGDNTVNALLDTKESTTTSHPAQLLVTLVDSGAPGATGPTGATGSTGSDGAPGAVGASGPIGLPGTPGATGAAGAPGATGLPGTPGATGAAGAPGATGLPGTPGATGAAGAPGATGLPGSPGATGLPGTPGATGAAGAPGATGLPGTPGATGAAGPSGAAGSPGATGPAGAAGSPGATGAAGPSGAAGSPGATGPAGAAGSPGATGPAGPSGAAGAKGATGSNGSNGSAGATGATGPAGENQGNGAAATGVELISGGNTGLAIWNRPGGSIQQASLNAEPTVIAPAACTPSMTIWSYAGSFTTWVVATVHPSTSSSTWTVGSTVMSCQTLSAGGSKCTATASNPVSAGTIMTLTTNSTSNPQLPGGGGFFSAFSCQ
ncbi:MAG TPA: DNRLRE domain-containing protein [Bryobacteraceae bacterium]